MVKQKQATIPLGIVACFCLVNNGLAPAPASATGVATPAGLAAPRPAAGLAPATRLPAKGASIGLAPAPRLAAKAAAAWGRLHAATGLAPKAAAP